MDVDKDSVILFCRAMKANGDLLRHPGQYGSGWTWNRERNVQIGL